jgi:glycosyltransferase involved in cell wall biosynthesis
MVSTLEPRKNFPGAISAFAEFLRRSRQDIKLLIVGRRGWNYERTLDAIADGLQHGWIVHIENVPFPELIKLYQGAEALLFPSFGEGFGFPPLEAMQCGTPALVSDIAVHRWVMQDAVLYANPYDRNAIVDQLNNLLGPARSETLDRLKAKWPSVLERYSISNVSQRWLELLQKLKADKSSGRATP